MQSDMARARRRSGRGGATTSSPRMQAAHVGQPQARVYAITQQEAPFLPDVITSILSIYGHDAHVLIDPGSTCSFIAYELHYVCMVTLHLWVMIFVFLCLLVMLQ